MVSLSVSLGQGIVHNLLDVASSLAYQELVMLGLGFDLGHDGILHVLLGASQGVHIRARAGLGILIAT